MIPAAPAAFDAFDFAVVLAAVGGMLAVGFLAGRIERDTRDFFLGARRLPGWAVCLSFLATEVSAMTIVEVPAEGYRANWGYLQMFIGSAAARVVVAFAFIPVFYRLDCTTIYEFLLRRFGPATQRTAVVLFFVTRLAASGLRLYVAAMAVVVVLGGRVAADARGAVALAIVAITAAGIAFIAFGGIKAVVWANVVQAGVFIAAGVAAVGYLCQRIDGGVWAAVETASAAGRLKALNLSLDWRDPSILPLVAVNGFFTSLAVFGTDHDLMQRLLTANTRRASQRSLLATIAVGLPVLVTYLAIGTLLFAFYAQHPGAAPADAGQAYPHFIAGFTPHGLRGLLLAAIVLASIDSPLASLSACFVNDIYRPLVRRPRDEQHYLLVSRISVAVFGVVLGLLAFAAGYLSNLLWVAFQVLGVTGGSLLGVFLLGLFTRRRGDRAVAGVMVVVAGGMAALLGAIHAEYVQLGWTWLIVLGTGLTFGVGWVVARQGASFARE